ncbi:MAG: AAA family ATPase [Eubacterium sp.]|nr:AAA family ATPase [Eubacterium sp.]
MRYYQLLLKAGAESIQANATIKLREYSYDSPVEALNNYMYRHLSKGINFVAFWEEKDSKLHAVFSFDEREASFENVYDEITNVLSDKFKITRVLTEPDEITVSDFYESINEGKRRGIMSNFWSKILDSAKIWLIDYVHMYDDHKRPFTFDELTITKDYYKNSNLLSASLRRELTINEKCRNKITCEGNVVHYSIAARSSEAAKDIAATLGSSLLNANRISGRRLEIISEMSIHCYGSQGSWIENIIENNYGGVVAFDLTERFGSNLVEYRQVCRYIEKLVKTHRNHCLFIFMYNMDQPGISYHLLPELKRHINLVSLREGSGDRAEALEYLKKLIGNSEYRGHLNLAEEFLMQYPQTEFTQTEVLGAFDSFGPWCLNKALSDTYSFDINGDYLLERDSSDEDPYEKLQKMIGLSSVKKQVDAIIASNLVEKERKKLRGSAYQSSTMHMIFAGDPGTAKTTVAKHFAGIARDKGILKSGAFVEVGGMDLCGPFCVDNIRSVFREAKGGVLFIDEAYAMNDLTAIAVLIQEMENRRDDVIVILAGYREGMKHFLKLNEGLKSRIPYTIDFPNYTADELTDIFKSMTKDRGFTVTDEAVQEARYIFAKMVHVDNFGNGRYVRNLIDRAIQNQAVRLNSEGEGEDDTKEQRLFTIIKDDISGLEEDTKEEKLPGTAMKELEELIGLSEAKELLNKAIALFRLKKRYLEMGISRERASMHMVFKGNPGTAKTTVARLFGEIMKDEKILPLGHMVEVGRADLVGTHVGHTAPKVVEKFKEAQGGILFIDEAYSLCDGYENGFGDEAITTIVQEMENHREDVIVIFAGYSEPMEGFLDRNPGMKSRVAFQVDFDDYSVEELCDITELMVSQRQMHITEEALDKLKRIYEEVSKVDDFGNGRFVRKILDEAEMHLAERLMDQGLFEITDEAITTIALEDIPDVGIRVENAKTPIGFLN